MMRTRRHRTNYTEHKWLTRAREHYSAARRASEARENRLCATDRGLEFVYRIKKAGYPR